MKKQFQFNHALHRMKMVCTWLGYQFAVVIDLKNKTVEFDPDTEFIPPTELVESSPEKDADRNKSGKDSECPGCGTGMKKLIKGGWGWAKNALGVDKATDDVAASRKAVCVACPSNCYDFGVCRDDLPGVEAKDQGCGCILSLKVLQASEECPHQHWLKQDASS